MPVITVDQYIQYLTSQGARVVEHETKSTAHQFDQPIVDGCYRIIQIDDSNRPVYASFNVKDLLPGQEEFPIEMSASPDFSTQFWQISRQYGVTNGYVILPMLTTPGLPQQPEGMSIIEPGGTTVITNNSVNVKRSDCYPVWSIVGSEAVTYWQGNEFKTVRFYTIRQVGSGEYWGTNLQQEVVTFPGTSDNHLYQIVAAGVQHKASVLSTDSTSVEAGGSQAVKRVYFSTRVTAEDIKRTYSVQLVTEAHDQGWASEPERGLWSWFEVAIFSKEPTDGQIVRNGSIKYGPNQEPLAWISHRVGLKSTFTEQTGAEFRKDHELWKNLEPGNYIGVLACAQYV
ncbi:hypothetical protein RhiJN_20069 [Ceratobasidium sp. AG-Ba]|nr:hypothetical protein RhiJN_20069 [Ceratobasidium sp. AG-Ba]